MVRVRVLWFVTVLAVATLVLGGVAIVLGCADRSRSLASRVERIWGRVVLGAGGVRVRIEGDEALPRPGAAIFVANHSSNLDVLVLAASLPHEVLWLAKRELFRVPVLGRAMRAVGYIPVDRGDRERARSSISEAAERVRAGFPVVLFPEGTRSPGPGLLPFKPGFVHLALATGAPVVPVALGGTARLWPKGALGARPGAVTVSFLPPMVLGGDEPEGEARALAAQVRGALCRFLGVEGG